MGLLGGQRMGNIRVVTDSCSGYPPDLATADGVAVIPLTVRFGDENFRDGVEMTSEAFYQRLTTAPQLPSTSQPSVGEFITFFQQVVNEHKPDGILVVTLSQKLSGTYLSACQAADLFRETPVKVIDSGTASLPQHFAARAAARAAATGATLEEAAQVAREVASGSVLYATLDTLEYLHRGGRIGRAAAWAGALLQLKPVVTIKEGEIAPVTRVRTKPKAIEFILARLEEEIKPGRPLHMGVVHAATPGEATALEKEVRQRFAPVDTVVSGLTPVMGTYGGPGVMGVAYYQE